MSTPKVYTEDELRALNVKDLEKIVAERDLAEIGGTGTDGNIVKADLVSAILAGQTPDKSPAAPVPAPQAGQPVVSPPVAADPRAIPMNQFTRRSDADVLPGQFCRVDTGDHAGRVGVFEETASIDGDGYPEAVTVRLRGGGERIVVDYADITPVEHGGR